MVSVVNSSLLIVTRRSYSPFAPIDDYRIGGIIPFHLKGHHAAIDFGDDRGLNQLGLS